MQRTVLSSTDFYNQPTLIIAIVVVVVVVVIIVVDIVVIVIFIVVTVAVLVGPSIFTKNESQLTIA